MKIEVGMIMDICQLCIDKLYNDNNLMNNCERTREFGFMLDHILNSLVL